ncbi:hypothetical protein FBULB1_10710 [Fusarium bulbicola]|nr:hypothetical protein FBULB1_10710 [Fusarium bulbicola]
MHLFSANVKISGQRVKCLFDEILRRNPDSQPLVVAVQDLCRKQAFTRLPGYNFWAADLGLITEDDYELSTREASQVKSIELARHAICAASISLDKVSDAMQDFSDAPPEIEEALFDIIQSLSSSRDALVVTHDTFAEARGTLSVAIESLEDAREVISKAQDAVPQIQGILFAALDELLGPLRVLWGVQRSFSCEDDAAARPEEERIRGVGFYVHSSLRTDQWRVRSYPDDNEDIFATLELTTPSGLLAIHNVYNHNNRLDVPALLQHLASYESSKCDMVLLRDFNYHHGSWSIRVNGIVTQKITSESKEFAAGVKGLGLKLQTTPGEITFSRSQDTGQQSSTIDLAFASRKLAPSVLSCKALQVPGFISDHRVIETVIRRQVKTHVRIIPQWQEADHEVFQKSLEPLLPPLDAPLDTDDQRDKYMTDIMYGLMEAINDNVPVRIRDSQPRRLKYLAKRMQRHTAKLDELKAGPHDTRSLANIRRIQRQISKHNQELWEMFTEDKSATTKGAYELAGIAKNICEPNQISQTPTLRLGDGVAETDSEKIEKIKKEKFPENDKPYSKSTPTEPRPPPANGRPESCMSQDLDDEHLRLIISKLQRHKAPGPDLIPNEAIQLGGDVLRSRLLRLFRSCPLHYHYPSPFKDSILVMVRKTGRPLADPKSWRPIALLSSFGKILDRIFGDKMLEVLRAHPDLLSSHQFGGRSTTEALQYLLTLIYNTWTFHPGDVVTIFGLDMSSGFDSVLRDRLLQNLVDKGFPPWYVTIVRGMLSDRTATMRIAFVDDIYLIAVSESFAQLSEFVGACIANEATPFREGTKGFYIRIKDTDKPLLVTCRHVLFNDSFPNVDYDHNDNAPNMDLGDKSMSAQREDLERAKDMKGKFEKLHEKKSRIIGHVLYSPNEMRNMVVARPRADRELWKVLYNELDDEDRRRVEQQLPFHHTNTYDLTRTVQEFEIRFPNEASRSLENQRAMVVAKFGRSTSLPFGVVNEVKSVCRIPVLGQEFISQEWCILGHKKRGQCRRPFSEDGDSGSCILDMYGRVGAMLTGGKLAQRDDPDISYATPIDWLLKDINEKLKKKGFTVKLA